jgi:hypothetical protein
MTMMAFGLSSSGDGAEGGGDGKGGKGHGGHGGAAGGAPMKATRSLTWSA